MANGHLRANEENRVESQIQHAKTKPAGIDGRIVETNNSDPSLKGQLDKKFSNVTEMIGNKDSKLDH